MKTEGLSLKKGNNIYYNINRIVSFLLLILISTTIYSTTTEIDDNLNETNEKNMINIDVFKKFQIYEPFIPTDSLYLQNKIRNNNTAIPNSEINISGSKSISISVSNNDMMDINQSLFLKIDGKVANNVFIMGQIQDNQTPFMAEGNTKELSSLDEVFFKVYGQEYEVAFGDLQFEMTKNQFLQYNPKFEGLSVSYYKKNIFKYAIAISNSKPAHTSFKGTEGTQGPYYLKPNGINSNVQILSGTESIWLDGKQMQRGTDYKIDYNEGSIEFLLKHFISRNSRIEAFFQYNDEFYKKKSIFSSNELNITDRLKLNASFVYMNDDKDNPISGAISDKDKLTLTQSSGNTIFISGESYIGNGLGNYKKETRLIDGKQTEIYVYATGDNDADYDVYFTYFGSNKGDYRQSSVNKFDYVGTDNGEWLPVKEIKSPENKANYDFAINYKNDVLEVNIESLFSEFSNNTFNKDNKQYGQIHSITTAFKPEWDNFEPELTTKYKYKNKDLFTFTEITDKNIDYQIEHTNPDTLDYMEYFVGLKSNYHKFLEQEIFFSLTDYDNHYQKNIINIQNAVQQKTFMPKMSYKYYLYDTDIDDKKKITIHEPQAEYDYKKTNFRYESRMLKNSNLIAKEDFKLYKYTASINEFKKSGLAISYSTENNKTNNDNSYSETWTTQTYTQTKNHYINALLSRRTLHTENIIKNDKQVFDIAEINTTIQIFNDAINLYSSYNMKNTEFYPKSRELIYVGKSLGLYDSTGVWTPDGEWDYISVILDNHQKSIEINTNISIYTFPNKFIKKKNDLHNFLEKINLETMIQANEQKTSNNTISQYFLLDNNNNYKIYSQREYRQNVWLNIVKNKLITRYSFINNNTDDDRYNEDYHRKKLENEYALQLLNVNIHDIEYSLKTKNETDSRYNMKSNILANEMNLKTKFSNYLIFNTLFGYENEEIKSFAQNEVINRYILKEEITYFYGAKWKYSSLFSIKYNNLKNKINTYLPSDKQKGYITDWNSEINYKINHISTFFIIYSGYKNPEIDTFHEIKMEFRAEFF